MLLRENMYKAIRRAILNGELPPGRELREQNLADQYRVSRSPVRDALLRLEQENLVTVMPRQGYLINPVTEQDIRELMGLRLLLEPACAAAAATADDSAVLALDKFRWHPGQPSHYLDFGAYDSAFHAAVVELSGNRRTIALARDLIEQVARMQMLWNRPFDAPHNQPFLDDHALIIDAIQAHDVETAFSRATAHVEASSASLLAAFVAATTVDAEPGGPSAGLSPLQGAALAVPGPAASAAKPGNPGKIA